MPELCEEMMKKGEEIDDNGDTMQIHDELHENFYRSKQNNEMANVDNSFCTPHNYNVRKQSVQKDLPKK